jgi:NADH-ubiquinone oxidoreductase chain 5
MAFSKVVIGFGCSADYLSIVTFCIIIGAVGKSAQLGLHSWLPDAMEGPTPVSALLHAATMVTAGIFILIKCSFLFEYNTNIKCVIIVWGLLTAFFSASIACVQTDLKKIIAYSTCSQLGYMVFTVGLSQYQISLFHLFNHAFFKAILFLNAGVVIHSFLDDQDIRKTGKLRNLLPSLYVINLIATLAITGFPFLTGFYSKDVIIETAYNTLIISNNAVYWLATVTAALTAFYSFKVLAIVFYEDINSLKVKVEKLHLISNFLFIPIVLLSLFSCFVGFMARELFIGLGQNSFTFIILPENYTLIENEFTCFYVKLIPLGVTIFSVLVLRVVLRNIDIYKRIFIIPCSKIIVLFLNNKWYFDHIVNSLGYSLFNFCYQITYKLVDKNILEHLFMQKLTYGVLNLSVFFLRFNTGVVIHHISLLLLGLIFFISIVTL